MRKPIKKFLHETCGRRETVLRPHSDNLLMWVGRMEYYCPVCKLIPASNHVKE